MGDRVSLPLSLQLEYLQWLHHNRQMWYNRPLPPAEWDTVLFTGLPGAGKTTMGTAMAIEYLRSGVRVYSNIYLRDNLTGRVARPVLTWLDVMRAAVEALESEDPAMIYLAEIQQLCDARAWQLTPKWWSTMMQERRHLGLGLMADTQHVSQVEKRLRMLIGRIVVCEPSPLREKWRRWPRFVTWDADLQLGDDPATVPHSLSKRKTVWVPSYAFHGHATWQLVRPMDISEMSEPQVLKEIAALRARAEELNKVSYLPSFADMCPAIDEHFPAPSSGADHPDGWHPAHGLVLPAEADPSYTPSNPPNVA